VKSLAAALLMLFAVFAFVLPSVAQEAPRRVVLVVTAGGDEARAKSASDAIRAQLGDLAVELVVEPPGTVSSELRDRLDLAARVCKEQDAIGAFFIELERPDDLLLYLVEPEAKRALVRRVKKPVGAEQAGVEELSLIVRSTTSALLEGREIGMEEGPELHPAPPAKPPPAKPPPAKPLPPKPPPPEPPPPGAESTGRLGVGYSGQAYAPESPWQSGLGVALSGSPDDRLFFGLAYVAFAPVEVENDQVRIRVARYPLEALARYEIPVGRLRFAGELGLTAELARRATTRTSSGVLATANDDRWLWGASPRVRVMFEVWRRTRLGVGVGLDVFFNNSKYVADLAGDRDTLLSPYRTRAAADAGLTVDLW
jgi:hypothetical protein